MKRDESLDIARGIALFLVIWGHLLPDASISPVISLTHLPTLFLVSGMLYKRHFDSNGEAVVSNLSKKAKRLVIPFLCFSCFAFVLNLGMLFVKSNLSLSSACDEFIQIFVFTRSLWFLAALFLMFVLAEGCRFLAIRVHMNRYIVTAAVFAIIYALCANETVTQVQAAAKGCWMLPFFLMGMFLGNGDNARKWRKRHGLNLICAVIAIIVFFFLYDPISYSLCTTPCVAGWTSAGIVLHIIFYYGVSFVLSGAILSISDFIARLPQHKFFVDAGQHSMDIYVLHMPFVYVFVAILPQYTKYGTDALSCCLCGLFAFLIASFITLITTKWLSKFAPYQMAMGNYSPEAKK